jgi:hypothetical protein
MGVRIPIGLDTDSAAKGPVSHVSRDRLRIVPAPSLSSPRTPSLGRAAPGSGGADASSIVSAARQYRPRDAGEPVGQRNCRDILVCPTVEIIQPSSDAMRGPVAVQPEAAGTVDEHTPQIGVSALRDASESGLAARRHLLRDEAEPGGEVSPARESGPIGHGGDHRRCHKRADTGHRHQPAAGLIFAGKLLEVAAEVLDRGIGRAVARSDDIRSGVPGIRSL